MTATSQSQTLRADTVQELHCVRAFAIRPSLNKMSDTPRGGCSHAPPETDKNLGLAVPGTAHVGYFSGQKFEFSVRSFTALCKISDVENFFKGPRSSYNFHSISTKLYGNHVIRGEYKLLPFLALKFYGKILWHNLC